MKLLIISRQSAEENRLVQSPSLKDTGLCMDLILYPLICAGMECSSQTLRVTSIAETLYVPESSVLQVRDIKSILIEAEIQKM
jgi:hypothetical protein